MNDQIADLLVRLRNAIAIGKFEVTIPSSKMKEVVLGILKKEGYVAEIKPITKNKSQKILKVIISGTNHPTHLRQISKPGQRIYVKSGAIPRPLRGLGLIVISTPAGMTTGKEASKKGLGGELICEVW